MSMQKKTFFSLSFFPCPAHPFLLSFPLFLSCFPPFLLFFFSLFSLLFPSSLPFLPSEEDIIFKTRKPCLLSWPMHTPARAATHARSCSHHSLHALSWLPHLSLHTPMETSITSKHLIHRTTTTNVDGGVEYRPAKKQRNASWKNPGSRFFQDKFLFWCSKFWCSKISEPVFRPGKGASFDCRGELHMSQSQALATFCFFVIDACHFLFFCLPRVKNKQWQAPMTREPFASFVCQEYACHF